MTKQMTPLRQRMIEDMTIRNMSPSTQKIYVAAVANFSIFHGRSPDKLTFEDFWGSFVPRRHSQQESCSSLRRRR